MTVIVVVLVLALVCLAGWCVWLSSEVDRLSEAVEQLRHGKVLFRGFAPEQDPK